MADVVVTVPKGQWQAWIDEGDLPGQPAEYVSHFWIPALMIPDMQPGDRVYIVAWGRLRGYAPLTGIERRCTLSRSRACLMREGGAVAVTIQETIRGFQGWRYRWWDRASERPFPDWQQPNAPLAVMREEVLAIGRQAQTSADAAVEAFGQLVLWGSD